jgi:hypothetical protein
MVTICTIYLLFDMNKSYYTPQWKPFHCLLSPD